MASASENRMPLLCELGWHRPRPLARWNNGYYFTKCSRCGCDLVRTTYGGWQEPQGFRVVWQAHAPANSNAAAGLVRERDEEAASSELPIQEVLRHLQNGDAEAEPADKVEETLPAEVEEEPALPADDYSEEPIEKAEPVAEDAEPVAEETDPADAAEASRAALSVIPDFMEDTRSWQVPPHTYVIRPARGDPVHGYAYQPEERGPGAFSRLRTRVTEKMAERTRRSEEDSGPGLVERSKLRFADMMERFRSGTPQGAEESEPIADIEPVAESEPALESKPVAESEPIPESEAYERLPREMHPAFVMAIPIALLLVVLVGLVLWGRLGGQPVEANVQRAAPISPDQGQPAFVTASVLNCRTSPSRQAESVAVLVRGDPVRLLARDGEWMSLVHEGGQCWALSRYFSIQAPM